MENVAVYRNGCWTVTALVWHRYERAHASSQNALVQGFKGALLEGIAPFTQ